MSTHKQWREGDENVCACGLRWGVNEDDPHDTTGESPDKTQKEEDQ